VRRAALLAAACALAAARAGRAADAGDTRRFSPSPVLSPYLSIDGTHTHGAGGVAFSVMGTYERRPLIFYKDGHRTADLVGSRLSTDVSVAWGALEWLDLGAALPLVVAQDGRGPGGDGLPDFAPGDPALALKAELLDKQRTGFGVALVGLATLPFGDARALAGEADATATGRLALELPLGPRFDVALNGGWRTRSPSHVDQIALDDELLLGAGASWRLTPRLALVAEANVATAGTRPFATAEQTPADANGGVRVHLWEGLQLVAGGGAGLHPGYGSPEWRAVLGVEAAPRRHDFDGDRIADGRDACVDVPGVPEAEGCPPVVAEAPAPPPAPTAPTDHDGDGLADADDVCPYLAEDKDGFRDDDGCPDPDDDLDLIADAYDADPHGAEDWDGYQDEDGLPDLDNDGDGIADFRDACPLEAGAGEDGCPGATTVVQAPAPDAPLELGDTIHPARPIGFEREKAALTPDGRKVVQSLAALLKAHPELGPVEVGVHTDAAGDPAGRMRLSEARAAAVVEALVAEGVERERVVPRGYGASDPVASDATEAGRARNRRVELRRLQDTAPPDPVETIPGRLPARRPAPRAQAPAGAAAIRIPGPLPFVPLRAELAAGAKPTVAALAETLRQHPEYRRVEIGVHTDGSGDRAWKADLTQRRAEVVREALVALGVAPERLVARGYGATRPVRSDVTVAGREANRRVELTVLEGEAPDAPRAAAEGKP
jgi:outer membrane protein OmpA-like peptidoglycan-associated protein